MYQDKTRDQAVAGSRPKLINVRSVFSSAASSYSGSSFSAGQDSHGDAHAVSFRLSKKIPSVNDCCTK